MKTKNFIRPLVVALVLLLIPFLAMTFNWQVPDPGSSSTDGVNWTLGDFVAMGTLIFLAGLAVEFVTSRSGSLAYKVGAGLAVFASFLLVWVNLAVGIIGSEDNPMNALYLGVIAIAFFGAIISKFQAHGMARTMLVAAVAQMVVPLIALMVNRPDFDPGVVQVFYLNAAFALIWATSALLFKSATGSNKVQIA
jgi:hypothetical protein